MGVVDRVRPAQLRRVAVGVTSRAAHLLAGPADIGTPPRTTHQFAPDPVRMSHIEQPHTEARAEALTAVLAAAVSPERDAAVLLAAAAPDLSSWSAGRLLSDAERERADAVAVAAQVRQPDGRIPLRTFAAALHSRRPLLSEVALRQLWDHVVLMDRLIPPPAVVATRPYAGARDAVRSRVRRWGHLSGRRSRD